MELHYLNAAIEFFALVASVILLAVRTINREMDEE